MMRTLGLQELQAHPSPIPAYMSLCDGGRTFEEMKLPMDLVSELPQIAIDCGFTVEDFDYLNMPEKEDDTLTITVTTDAAEKDGIVFQSTDYGATWEYKGLVQIAN